MSETKCLDDVKVTKKITWKSKKGLRLTFLDSHGKETEAICFSYVKNWTMLELGQVVTVRLSKWKTDWKVTSLLINLTQDNFVSIVKRAKKVLTEKKLREKDKSLSGMMAAELRFAATAIPKEFKYFYSQQTSGSEHFSFTPEFVEHFSPQRIKEEPHDWPMVLKSCKVRRMEKLLACHLLVNQIYEWLSDCEKQLKEEVRRDLEQRFLFPSLASSRLVQRIKAGKWPKHLTVQEVSAELVKFPWSCHFSVYKTSEWQQQQQHGSETEKKERDFRAELAKKLEYKAKTWEVPYFEIFCKLKAQEKTNQTFIYTQDCESIATDDEIHQVCNRAKSFLVARGKTTPYWLDKDGIDDFLVFGCDSRGKNYLQREFVRRCEETFSREQLGFSKLSGSIENPFALPHLNQEQNLAIQMCITNVFSVVCGSAGTGKTAVIREVIKRALAMGKRCLLLCQYNKPLANLRVAIEDLLLEHNTTTRILPKPPKLPRLESKSSSVQAMTLASFLYRNKPTQSDLILIEEAGVMDLLSFHQVMKKIHKCEDKAHVSLIGDPHQLLPIGLGHPFAQIIQFFPDLCTKLTQVYRQNSESCILANASALLSFAQVQAKSLQKFKFKQGSDCCWIKTSWIKSSSQARSKFSSVEKLKSLFDVTVDEKRQDINFNPEDLTVVVVPTSNMALLINTFIHHLRTRQTLPPSDNGSEYFTGHDCLASGCYKKGITRVMTIEKTSHYQKNIMGIISDFDDVKKEFTIETTQGTLQSVTKNNVMLAYAATNHRLQGSQFKNVVVIPSAHWKEVDARWLYTALTRAMNHLTLICDKADLDQIVSRGFRNIEYLTL